MEEEEEEKRKKEEKFVSAHQEARINKRRRVSAGESCEWLSFLFVFSVVLFGWFEF